MRGRRVSVVALLLENVLPDRRPAGATVLLGPVRCRPALGVQDLRPAQHGLAAQMIEAIGGLTLERRRQVFAYELAHFEAKRFVLG